jgi:uncharacterized membrane protein HdeD (DUF308 family)
MVTRLTRKWWLLALRGMVAMLFGLAALVWPGATLNALVLLFGAYALVDGLLALVVSLLDPDEFDRGWALLLKGLAGIGIGVVTFLWPSVTSQSLLYLIAAWAVLTGVFEVVAALDLRNVVEGERQLAWGNLIEHEMMGTC